MKKWILLVLTGAMLFSFCACGAEKISEETTVSSLPDGITVTYYHPNKHGSHLTEETAVIEKLTAQGLLELLAEEKVIPEGTRVRNFRLSQGIITLDLSKEFEKEAKGLSSAREKTLIGSLVNTFLTAYEAEGVDLTVEGRRLVTGRKVYDEILRFYE